MTFVLAGMGADGAVLIADRRVVDQHRLELVTDEQLKSVVAGQRFVLSFDGINTLWEGIPRDVEDSLKEAGKTNFMSCLQAVRLSAAYGKAIRVGFLMSSSLMSSLAVCVKAAAVQLAFTR